MLMADVMNYNPVTLLRYPECKRVILRESVFYISDVLFLQLLCRLVFMKKFQYHPTLLCDPPQSIAEPLSKVLQECSKPGHTQIDWNVFRKLKSLLMNSIHNTT